MCETEKDDSDDQLSKEEKEWRSCDVQNPFITENQSVRRTGANKIA
jgi:hypothetical protein